MLLCRKAPKSTYVKCPPKTSKYVKSGTSSAERVFQEVRTSSEEMTSQDVEKWSKMDQKSTKNGPKWGSKVTKMDQNGPHGPLRGTLGHAGPPNSPKWAPFWPHLAPSWSFLGHFWPLSAPLGHQKCTKKGPNGPS